MAALCDLGDPCWRSLVSALSFIVSITLLPGPLCGSVFLCFASCSEAILNDTQDVIMQIIPIAGSDPTLCAFRLFSFVVVLCLLFAWFVCFWCVFCLVSCWDSSLDCVQVHYQYFCGYRQVDSLAWQLQFIILLRVNVCNDLAEAMKALEGKNTRGSKVYRRPMEVVYGRWGCWFEVQSNGNGFHGLMCFDIILSYQLPEELESIKWPAPPSHPKLHLILTLLCSSQ